MTVTSNSVDIQCDPEEAFDYLSDHRSELEWNPGIESIDKLTGGPVSLGAKSGSSPRRPGPGSHLTSMHGRTGSSGSPSRCFSGGSAKRKRRRRRRT